MVKHSDSAPATIPKAVGMAQLVIGIVAAYYGPLEIFVFYLFSEVGEL